MKQHAIVPELAECALAAIVENLKDHWYNKGFVNSKCLTSIISLTL